MKNFIELTLRDGIKKFIRKDKIVSISNDDDDTIITTDDDSFFYVKETPNRVLELLGEIEVSVSRGKPA